MTNTGKKALTIGEYTRKIDRTYNNMMFEGASQESYDVLDKDGLTTTKMRWKFVPSNVNDANDYLIGALFGLTKDEVDGLLNNEWDKLFANCMKAANPK